MDEVYVRKDVFDAEIARLESENLRICEKFAYVFQQQGLKYRKEIDALRIENEALKERLADLKDTVNRQFTILAFCITAIGALIAGLQLLGG